MSDIADKIYAATGLTLGAEAAAAIRQMIQQARRAALAEAAEVARKVPIPDECCHNEAHGRLSSALEAAMRIRALMEKKDE